ncbi:hypothetical protein [Vibrio sp. 10N.261.46.A3]|uniref:hypothetical protein n=1 Tax=Vibrio sp. 10N.261.46.A3 TaxID=3229658 RepID=UPI00354F6E94
MESVKKVELIEKVLFTLNKNKTRATYESVARLLGLAPYGVSKYLGHKRPHASWVVSKSNKLPTGYVQSQYHPDLFLNDTVIGSVDELNKLLEKDQRDLT